LTEHYRTNPSTLPRINRKEQNKTQIVLDRWKSIHLDVQEAINNSKKTCTRIWIEVDEILEIYHMPLNKELNRATSSEIRVKQVMEITERVK
jgi:hypothetical protein